MKTNDLKKGDRVLLLNGWKADVMDNRKGDRRMLKVYGFATEMGDVYSHDILAKIEDHPTEHCIINGDEMLHVIPIEHTKKQLELRDIVNSYGMGM